MARLPILKRIQREDFPEAPPWMDKLIYILNTFMEAVYNALNRSLVFGDNVAADIKEFTFTTLPGYDGTADPPGTTTFTKWTPLTFVRSIKTTAKGCLLLQIYLVGVATYTPIAGNVYMDWSETNGTITIGLVRGLTASTKYTLRVLLI